MNEQKITIIPGVIHSIVPVDVQPVTVMIRWRLVQVRRADDRRTRHLVGRADEEGRVSSEIVKLDLQALAATTKSGRVYVLEGPPGRDGDAAYVFGRWLSRNGLPNPRDMTRALISLRGRRPGGRS
jgi:hypothetical protein